MPDDVSRTSGQHYLASSNTSQHTSSHSTDLHTEHTPTHVPVPPPAAASEDNPSLPPFPSPSAGSSPGAALLRVVVADDNPVVRAGLTALLTGRDDIQVVAEAADGRQAYDAARQHQPDVVLLDVRMPGVDGISALPHLVRLAPVLMLTYSRESEIVHEALRLGAGGYLVHGEFTADQLVAAVRDIKEGRAYFTATASNALIANLRGGEPSQPAPPLPEGIGTAFTGPGYQPTPPPQRHAPAHGYPNQSAQPWPTGQQPRGVAPVSNVPHFPRNTSHPQPDVASSAPVPDASRAERFGLSQREVEVMELIASGMANPQIAAACFISEKTVKNHINRIFTKLHAATRSEAIAVWLGTARGGTASHG